MQSAWVARLNAFVFGALAVLAFAPVGWHLLAPLSLAGLLFLLDGRNARQAFHLSWFYGLGLFGAGVSWIYVSLTVYGGMPMILGVLATVLFCAFLAVFPAVAGWLAIRLAMSGWLGRLLVFPGAWVLMEWVRGWVFTGFPWLAFGYAQVPDGPLAGYAPVLGVYGLSWLTAICAGLLVWLARDAGLPGKWMAPFAMLILLLGGGEALKKVEWTQPDGAPINVALLQGNVAQEMKWRPEKAAETLLAYASQIGNIEDARLVVMPETALPMFFQDLPPAYVEQLRAWSIRHDADILFGVPTGELAGAYYNSVASVGKSPTQFYHKNHLVVFGEFVPPGFGWIVKVLQIPLSDFSRGGKEQEPLLVAGQKLAVNICYEDVFGEELIRALPEATMLANVTNDAWFGDSFAGWQHAQMSQMRALETGRTMLRATNTGVTAIINQKGRVLSSLPEFAQGTLQGKAQGFTGSTPYARWGNWPVMGTVWLMIAWLAWRRRAKK